MPQSSVFTLTVATAVLGQLQALLDRSSQPCLDLRNQVSALAAQFLSAPITPAATLDFENALRQLHDECGRLILQSVFNQVEPSNPHDAPKHTQRDRQDYARKNQKSP